MRTLKTPFVSLETAHRINELHAALRREFGGDFAYSIAARGHLVSASNYVDGLLQPATRIRVTEWVESKSPVAIKIA